MQEKNVMFLIENHRNFTVLLLLFGKICYNNTKDVNLRGDSMSSNERRHSILNILEQEKTVYTADLAERLNVSAMTVRRDFEQLSRKGLVTIIRGGAALNVGSAVMYRMNYRQTQMPLEKQRIAEYCANLVQEGNSVFLDCGTTVERIAETLSRKSNITVLTNSLNGAQILSTAKKIQLIMVPGEFSEEQQGFGGQITSNFMERFNVDIYFLGVVGLDPVHGLTSTSVMDGETSRSVMKHAKKVIAVLDHTKLGCVYFKKIADVKEVDLIVTDSGADDEIIRQIRAKGGNVITV